MNPDEIEFVGEKTKIGIIPNFNFDPIHLISGTIGPFCAGLPVHIPLWLAIHLRKQQKCRLVPPEWMDTDLLDELKEEEKQTKHFVKLPSDHYMIVAKLVLGSASEDVPHSEEIRTLIKDIWDMRLAKLRTVMDAYLKGEGTQTKLDNITMLEIHSIRPFFPHMLDLISRLEKSVKISTNQGNTSRNMSSDHRR